MIMFTCQFPATPPMHAFWCSTTPRDAHAPVAGAGRALQDQPRLVPGGVEPDRHGTVATFPARQARRRGDRSVEALGVALTAAFLYALYFVVRAGVRDGVRQALSDRAADTAGDDGAPIPGGQQD